MVSFAIHSNLDPFGLHEDVFANAISSFNRLDLPPYKNLDMLQGKLTMAVEETMGFGQE
jgi:hypothetical protein